MRLQLERLEKRDALAVVSSLQGSILNLIALPGSPHNVLVRPTANVPGSIDVLADGQTTSFSGLTQVNYQGGNQGDTFTNRTTLAGTLNFGNGANVVYTIAPGSTVTAGNGGNILQVTGGSSSIRAGNGDNNIYGGPNDTITAGNGTNVIYDILPGNQTITVGQHGKKVDHLFVGPQSTLIGAQAQDHVATFFTVSPLGSGTLVQSGATLYFTATNAGNQLYEFGDSSRLVAVYNLNDGAGFHTQVFTGITQLANFGGSGNDTFINNSTVDDVQYGAGGSNLLVGGFGALDLEKAGGQAATGSVAVGRSAVANDLNGSGLTNTSNTLIFAGSGTAMNITRTNSPTDTVVGLKTTDVLISLYPDNVIAALLPFFVPA